MPEYRLSQVHRLQAQGDLAGAIALCRQIVIDSPRDARAVHVLGLLHHQIGEHARSAELIGRSIELSPGSAEFHSNLAAVLGAMGQHAQAAGVLARAIELRPDHPVAHYNLGMALELIGRLPEALAAYERAAQLKPDHVDAWAGMGDVLRKRGQMAQAEIAFRRAAELDPKRASLQYNLARISFVMGKLEDALTSLRAYTDLAPHDHQAHSGLLYRLHYLPEISPEQMFEEHLAWAKRHAQPFQAAWRPHANDRSSDRRLRIGYISADFREHPNTRFVEPAIANHDHKNFEVFCYSDVQNPDAITARTKSMADTWREVAGWPDEQLAEQVRRDRIDVLVEVTGHMTNHRLLVYARKPAPVQVAWPGYPNTTGVPGIDYLITDADRDPPGVENRYAEKLIRLDTTSQCYQPGDLDLTVAPPPQARNGCITFGSLNNPMKLNAQVAEAWAKILGAVPTSRLLLLAIGGSAQRAMELFSKYPACKDRVSFARQMPRREYLALHGQIDINLDPWPYNGHTTILDGLWMGVPAIALEGSTHVAREGAAALRGVGLSELVAHSVDEYIEIALALAEDPARLSEIRRTLRDRMKASPLMDAVGLTQRLEAVYRQLWREWCRQRQ